MNIRGPHCARRQIIVKSTTLETAATAMAMIKSFRKLLLTVIEPTSSDILLYIRDNRVPIGEGEEELGLLRSDAETKRIRIKLDDK